MKALFAEAREAAQEDMARGLRRGNLLLLIQALDHMGDLQGCLPWVELFLASFPADRYAVALKLRALKAADRFAELAEFAEQLARDGVALRALPGE